MEGGRERFGNEIERCMSKLRSSLKALDASRIADESVIRELTKITDDIERNIGRTGRPWVKAAPD